MKQYRVTLDNLTAFLIEEFARKSEISVEEAIRRCVLYVVKELMPARVSWKVKKVGWKGKKKMSDN